MEHKKPFLLPEGTEIAVGFVAAALVLWWMVGQGYSAWAYIPSVPLVYFAFWYMYLLFTEKTRLYIKAVKILDKQIQPVIEQKIKPYIRSINHASPKGTLDQALDYLDQILDELGKKSAGVMYSGYSEVATQIARLGVLLPEYIDIQDHPAKAQDWANEMQKAEEGFEGFREWSRSMAQRVNSGDVFNMNTNAELLRSLRNLLGSHNP